MATKSSTGIKIYDKEFEPFLSEQEISHAIQSIADEINSDYRDKTIVLVGVLKGAFVFLSELVKKIKLPINIEFVRVSSYQGVSSTGEITMSMDFPKSIIHQHVILIEDIIDSGRTAKYLVNRCKNFKPASVRIATLLIKPDCVAAGTPIDYVGISIPDRFVVGFGMDYDEMGRELPEIYQLC